MDTQRQAPDLNEVLTHLKRCSFLLNSARLVLQDPASRQTAREAVEQAEALIKRAEQGHVDIHVLPARPKLCPPVEA
jgi:hypothetical protein